LLLSLLPRRRGRSVVTGSSPYQSTFKPTRWQRYDLITNIFCYYYEARVTRIHCMAPKNQFELPY
jgi:hypothetical protein